VQVVASIDAPLLDEDESIKNNMIHISVHAPVRACACVLRWHASCATARLAPQAPAEVAAQA
jgi:hypothetical protein